VNEPETSEPYRIEAAPDRFQVVDAVGDVILTCSDEDDAAQYAALLSHAYHRGYKAGYRQAKQYKR